MQCSQIELQLQLLGQLQGRDEPAAFWETSGMSGMKIRYLQTNT
jgi:hypothetical protein